MNNKIGLSSTAILAGVLAAFLSLVTSALLDGLFSQFQLLNNQSTSTIIALVIVEEILKLLIIYQFISIFIRNSALPAILFFSLLIGFGFGLAEMGLIFLGQAGFPALVPLGFIFLVHLSTSALLGAGCYSWNRKNISGLFFIFMAFFLHCVYNLFASGANQ